MEAEFDYADSAPVPDLGPCCICGQRKPDVRNLLCLDVRARTPEAGCWGCYLCGLPHEGTGAVLCDGCLEAYRAGEAAIRFAVDGPLSGPESGRRVGLGSLLLQQDPFEHDLEKHALEDFGRPLRRCRQCGCTDYDCQHCIEPALSRQGRTGEPCAWVEEDLCSACFDEAQRTFKTKP